MYAKQSKVSRDRLCVPGLRLLSWPHEGVMEPTLLGQRILTQRRAKGWTQRQLAEAADVRRATIAELESGKRTTVRSDTAVALASALGVTLDWLLTGKGESDIGK